MYHAAIASGQREPAQTPQSRFQGSVHDACVSGFPAPTHSQANLHVDRECVPGWRLPLWLMRCTCGALATLLRLCSPLPGRLAGGFASRAGGGWGAAGGLGSDSDSVLVGENLVVFLRFVRAPVPLGLAAGVAGCGFGGDLAGLGAAGMGEGLAGCCSTRHCDTAHVSG